MPISLHLAERMRAEILIAEKEKIKALAEGRPDPIGLGRNGVPRNVRVPWYARLRITSYGWYCSDIRDGHGRVVL